ncbi:hypothetical protein KGF54_003713 [Candida jiufengensis]|uniref:uncharacterized protein n=1 Tax=Candida jiufengensis TaxID=497108 RepID=UPI002224BC23|nr:uncharacterized protein KGF54_003713 [Candida jiufengensis]KAI5952846.1 hypothetical protein KGF54_003713 [Candida jiufengensis]
MSDQQQLLQKSSSEAVTKYLRSKDESLSYIIKLAHEVLDKKLNIYFPNYKVFILNLLIDRLNDKSTSQFGKWKFNEDVWGLLMKTWGELEADSKIRDDTICNLKTIDILIQVLNHNDNSSRKCLESIFDLLQDMENSTFIEIDESSGLSLLKSYLTYLQDTTAVDDIWTQIIQDLYYRSCMIETQDLSKKAYSNFMDEVLNPLISVLSSPTIKPQTSSKMKLQDIFKLIVFNSNHIQHLRRNLEKVLKKQITSEHSLLYFYKIAVQELSTKNMKLCEEIYTLITTTFPSLSEPMLLILTESKKPISPEFIASLYNEEVDKKNFKDLNWSMVKYIFEIDSELASKKSRFLFEKYNSDFGIDEKVLPVGKVILASYIENRELVEFITKVWPKAILKDELWDSKEFIIDVSRGIKSLSERQIMKIIEDSIGFEFEITRAIFVAITIGLAFSSTRIVESLRGVFEKNKSFVDSKDEFWQVHYNLLILYGSEFSLPEDKLKLDYDLYYYFTLFRLLELGTATEFKEDQQQKFLKFLNDNKNFIPVVFKRWFIIFNNYFSRVNQTKILELICSWDDHNDNEELLSSINNQFYEQRRLTTTLIDLLIENPKLNYSAIKFIPVNCYHKGMRKDLVNSLTKSYLKDQNIESLQSLSSILNEPSYQSDIEKNLSVLIQVLEVSQDDNLKNLAFEIATKIWKSHIDSKRVKDTSSQSYIENSIDLLTKYLKQNQATQVSPKVELCSIILSQHIPIEFNKSFQDQFNSHCISAITTSIKNQNLSTLYWYLWALASIDEFYTLNFESVQNIIKQLDSKLSEHAQIRKSIFKLVCKSAYLDIDAAKYVMSLFIINTNISDTDLDFYYDNLVAYAEKIATEEGEVYNQLCEYLIHSSIDLKEDRIYVNSICLIISAYSSKSSKETSSIIITGLFAVLITYSSKIVKADASNEILVTIKTLLTENQYIFNQHLLEMTLVLVQKIATSPNTDSKVYIKSTQVISNILLHHRYKLSTRHHLLINIMSSLLELLASSFPLGNDIASAKAFARLMTNLCEPQERINEQIQDSNNLTTSANFFKKSLRNHLPILMNNFIYFSLKYNYNKEVNDILIDGIYLIFDLLSSGELQIINSSLDYGGKALFKTMYHNYNEFWKWKDQ